MSMPTFPPEGLELTQEQVFNMLLGSIAMEELALSHILNAEGEKLQYVLGSLEDAHGPICPATVAEVLKVNKSVSEVLESVAYNQRLLKGKLAQVLEAKEKWCPAPCEPEGCKPCCPAKTAETCVFRAANCPGWAKGHALPWRWVCGSESALCWQDCTPSVLRIGTERSYLVCCSLRLHMQQAGKASVTLQGVGGGTGAQDIIIMEGVAGCGQEEINISGCTVISPACCCPPYAGIQLILSAPDCAGVERAGLSITPL